MHDYAKYAFSRNCIGILYVLVFLGGTWKDGERHDGQEEGIKGDDLGGWLRTWYGRGTGRNEVLEPNCYIVAGLFCFQNRERYVASGVWF